jgi:hypothetical protein
MCNLAGGRCVFKREADPRVFRGEYVGQHVRHIMIFVDNEGRAVPGGTPLRLEIIATR